MSKCPDCGRENVTEPAGYDAPCGRRVGWGDAPGVLYPHESQWRERMGMAQRCKPERIEAPWDDETVKKLNAFQKIGYIHPFTCEKDHGEGFARDLIATKDGWRCPSCDYKQDWAYALMLDPPPNPIAGRRGRLQ